MKMIEEDKKIMHEFQSILFRTVSNEIGNTSKEYFKDPENLIDLLMSRFKLKELNINFDSVIMVSDPLLIEIPFSMHHYAIGIYSKRPTVPYYKFCFNAPVRMDLPHNQEVKIFIEFCNHFNVSNPLYYSAKHENSTFTFELIIQRIVLDNETERLLNTAKLAAVKKFKECLAVTNKEFEKFNAQLLQHIMKEVNNRKYQIDAMQNFKNRINKN